MKSLDLSLLAAAAAVLALQACDVRVDDATTAQSGSTASEPAPAPAPADSVATLPADKSAAPSTDPAAPAVDGSMASTAPATPPVAAGSDGSLAEPPTAMMGGPADTDPSVAAPTELGQFLAQNPVRPQQGSGGEGKP